MNMVPRYHFAAGTELTLHARRVVLNSQTEVGYETVSLEDGTVSVIPFQHFLDYLALPGSKIDTLLPQTGNRATRRLGGHTTARALTKNQQEVGRFHVALCQAMLLLRDQIRRESDDPTFELSGDAMNRRENRKFVKDIAESIFGQKIYLARGRGGKSTTWGMYKPGLFTEIELDWLRAPECALESSC
mgnify:CR=1 FL=1